MNTQQLDDSIYNALNKAKGFSGKIVLITGGPTCEDIDPVRFITNRSTGRMGIESAIATKEAGMSPILILGPTHLAVPDKDIPIIHIRSAEMLYYTVDTLFSEAEFIIMSAAVADFTPVTLSQSKLKKSEIEDKNHEFTLKLKRTVDILSSLNNRPERQQKFIAGFSLDTSINIAEGMRKLNEKSLDLVVVNSTDAFESNNSNILIITKDGKQLKLFDNNKRNTASTILSELLRLQKQHQ